ncbi:MAG: hypothetical protein ACK4ZO_02765, partial [Cyanobacteriota bacterium]
MAIKALPHQRDEQHTALQPAAIAAALAQRDRLGGPAAAALVPRSGRPLWLVDDSLRAYQELARFWRRRLAL